MQKNGKNGEGAPDDVQYVETPCWDSLMGWIQTNSPDNNGHVEIGTDTGRLIIRDGHLYGYIKNRLITVDGKSVQRMRTQHYLPSAGLNEFDPVIGTWRF